MGMVQPVLNKNEKFHEYFNPSHNCFLIRSKFDQILKLSKHRTICFFFSLFIFEILQAFDFRRFERLISKFSYLIFLLFTIFSFNIILIFFFWLFIFFLFKIVIHFLYVLDRFIESSARHEASSKQLEIRFVSADVDHRKSGESHPSRDEIYDIDSGVRIVRQDIEEFSRISITKLIGFQILSDSRKQAGIANSVLEHPNHRRSLPFNQPQLLYFLCLPSVPLFDINFIIKFNLSK